MVFSGRPTVSRAAAPQQSSSVNIIGIFSGESGKFPIMWFVLLLSDLPTRCPRYSASVRWSASFYQTLGVIACYLQGVIISHL